MPVSGHEETGVKSFAGQFSGLTAGVPIKKRWWFSLNQPSSPLTEETSSHTVETSSHTEETELRRKENSSNSQGSTISNASVAGAPIKKRWFPLLQASSSPLEEGPPPEVSDVQRKEYSTTSQGSTLSTSTSGLSYNNGNPTFEERKASPDATNANMVLRPKLVEPNVATQSFTSDVMDTKEKAICNDGYKKKMGSHMITGNPELLFAAKQSLALNMGPDMSKQSVQEICKQESSVVPEITGLPLGLKEHLFPAVTSTGIKEHQKIGKAEPVSLELSLSKEECSTQTSSRYAKTKSDTSHVHSNRANWDLNTTMDAWEESGTDATSVKASHDVVKTAGSVRDEKQLMCSTRLALPTGIESLKKTTQDIRSNAEQDGQHCKFLDHHNLCSTSYLENYTDEPSRLSVMLNSGNAIPTVSLTSVVAPAVHVNASSFRSVKLEPVDENLKRDLKESNVCLVASVDSVSVKQEFVQHSSVESSNSSTVSDLKFVEPRFVKSEPSHESNKERPRTAESRTDQLGKNFPQGSDSCSSAVADPITLVSVELAHPAVKPVCLSELTTTHENLVSHHENITHTAENVEKVTPIACSSAEQVPLETVAIPMVYDATELGDPSMKGSSITPNQENADDHDDCRLKLMNEPPARPRDIGEGCVSDEEKITLLADMLEDSYGSDSESDDNHAVTVCVDTERYVEDDDYEDGEVREPLEHSTAEDSICEVREVKHPDNINYENKQIENGAVICDCPTTSHAVENDNNPVIHGETSCGEEDMDIDMPERPGTVVDKTVCLQESVDDEKPGIISDGKQVVNFLQRYPIDLSERKTIETELYSNQCTDASHGVDAVQCADEVVKTTDIDFPKMEMSANPDEATKDVCSGGGGNQGRIIDLSRAASSSSPGKTRPISGRSLPSRAGRDMLCDTLDGDKIHKGRDEVYIDGPHKFSRERHQDMSPRNSRMSFVRGRGRVNSRLDSFRGDWESNREFSGEFYDGPSQFRTPRPKYASAVDSDMEYNNVAPDGSYVGHSRIGRKPLNDGSYIAPCRRSPGGRDAIQMGHRIPRTISQSRCIGGDGSEMVGMRHGEKFMRGFPEDAMDSIFTRPQPFDGLDGRFARGGRNFSSLQRRGPPRIRSKSPIRSRSRSPGPWSSPRRRSPRRRSPDGFGGHQELNHRRSSLYRVDRMRSPDRPVFPGERVVRRHGSPSYMSRPSNDIRDIDSARDHGHPRPGITNRNPSGRVLIRNRRFAVLDPPDRADNDNDYFAGPMHSGRILDLGNEGNAEERRRFGERRGPVRSFRPPYNNNVSENFHLNAEDEPRQYRFCSDDSDFHERGNNMRERGFDRRIKGRPGNVPPRRTRNMDEQEENFRHGGQVWSDDSFDDISRVKRKRF